MDLLTLETSLSKLADTVIGELTREPFGIREGVVMTPGKTPYRRLDCDGRALAYVRTRVRKRLVRVDVSGLWSVPRMPDNAAPNASGMVAIMIRSDAELAEAVEYLKDIVAHTRALRSAA